MEELTIQLLIKAKYSGALNESGVYFSLTFQTIAVLIGGLVLWRAVNAYHRKKQQQRSRNRYFETPYSKQWRK